MTGQELVNYAKQQKGIPYFFGAKMQILTNEYMAVMHKAYPGTVTDSYMAQAKRQGQVGKVNTDCSGLIYGYTRRNYGSAQLYSMAYTRLAVSDHASWANGVVVWRSGHVGVFYRENGKEYVVEAKGINCGVVISDFDANKWMKGLTFSWMSYSYETNVVSNATWKQSNPYAEPSAIVKKGMKGDAVRWVQWELKEAGYNLAVDGIAGPITDNAIRAFQKSCKIAVDGKVGPITRKCLKAN